MNQADAVATRMVERLFAGRKGHGGGACSYRVLRPPELREIVKLAYEMGWKDGSGQKTEEKP